MPKHFVYNDLKHYQPAALTYSARPNSDINKKLDALRTNLTTEANQTAVLIADALHSILPADVILVLPPSIFSAAKEAPGLKLIARRFNELRGNNIAFDQVFDYDFNRKVSEQDKLVTQNCKRIEVKEDAKKQLAGKQVVVLHDTLKNGAFQKACVYKARDAGILAHSISLSEETFTPTEAHVNLKHAFLGHLHKNGQETLARRVNAEMPKEKQRSYQSNTLTSFFTKKAEPSVDVRPSVDAASNSGNSNATQPQQKVSQGDIVGAFQKAEQRTQEARREAQAVSPARKAALKAVCGDLSSPEFRRMLAMTKMAEEEAKAAQLSSESSDPENGTENKPAASTSVTTAPVRHSRTVPNSPNKRSPLSERYEKDPAEGAGPSSKKRTREDAEDAEGVKDRPVNTRLRFTD